MRRLRVLLCGYGHLGLALLQGMLECADACEVVGVFRWSSRPESASCWEPVEGMFQKLVRMSGIQDVQCQGVNTFEFTALLEALKPDVVMIGAWGEIVKVHLIERPNLVLVNCHPSLLPAHRGANPYASVIRERETETGVTFHRVTPKIDAGAILLQQAVPVGEHDTGASVRDRCTAVAYQLVKEMVARLHSHVVQGQPLEETAQDAALKSYHGQLKNEDGLIDWTESPEMIYRQYRALYPWIACYGHLEGKRKVLFFDPRFVQRPAELPPDTVAGMIVWFHQGTIRVALSDSEWLLEVSAYQIEYGRSVLPMWLGKILSPWLLRPGRRFLPPSAV
ncbi:MAG TPA: formyltransferase family protein [Coleofasciculaceae cyanobacterium]